MKHETYIKALKNLEPSARELTPREFVILSYKLGATDGNEHTFEETGKAFKISRQRADQICKESMTKMEQIDNGLDRKLD